jgi:hypothetical protein
VSRRRAWPHPALATFRHYSDYRVASASADARAACEWPPAPAASFLSRNHEAVRTHHEFAVEALRTASAENYIGTITLLDMTN